MLTQDDDKRPWTPEDEAKLKELAGQGVYLTKIALRLSRSESSIKKLASQIGLRIPNTPRGSSL